MIAFLLHQVNPSIRQINLKAKSPLASFVTELKKQESHEMQNVCFGCMFGFVNRHIGTIGTVG